MRKDKSIKIRVSQDEHNAIHAIAKNNGKTLSEFIRSFAQQPMESSLNKNG